MRLPGLPRRPPVPRRPRPYNFRLHSTLFSAAASRYHRGSVRFGSAAARRRFSSVSYMSGPPGSPGVKGGIDILDAHSGALRLRVFLPQQLMTDIDGLHGSFLATDENGQRLFAITSSDGTPQNAALTSFSLPPSLWELARSHLPTWPQPAAPLSPSVAAASRVPPPFPSTGRPLPSSSRIRTRFSS